MRLMIITLAFISLLINGCGEKKPDLVKVTGKVVYKDQPVSAGNIFLYPDGGNEYQKDKPSSQLQLDGSFSFKTFPFGDGVPLGKYKVVLSPDLATRFQKPAYADPEKTPWEIEVTSAGISDKVLEVK